MKPRVDDGGPNPVLALLDGGVRQADGGVIGETRCEVDLHIDGVGVYAQYGCCLGFGQHGLSPGCLVE